MVPCGTSTTMRAFMFGWRPGQRGPDPDWATPPWQTSGQYMRECVKPFVGRHFRSEHPKEIVGNDKIGTKGTGHPFDPIGNIHRVAEGTELAAPRQSDGADNQRTGMYSDADAGSGQGSGTIAVPTRHGFAHSQATRDRIPQYGDLWIGGNPHRDGAVTDMVIERRTMSRNLLGHFPMKAGQEGKDLDRGNLFRQRGESHDIRKEHHAKRRLHLRPAVDQVRSVVCPRHGRRDSMAQVRLSVHHVRPLVIDLIRPIWEVPVARVCPRTVF